MSRSSKSLVKEAWDAIELVKANGSDEEVTRAKANYRTVCFRELRRKRE